jgi:hypothetical protein
VPGWSRDSNSRITRLSESLLGTKLPTLMVANSSIVLEGVLKADGTLELDHRPELPPGRVRVKLETLTVVHGDAGPRPDPPWLDESIPAPFDLPLPGPSETVELREVAELLPDPFEWNEEDARP